MEPAEGSHGTPAAVEKGEEGATCTETAKLEETGEESATCTDATELKEPAQEKMQTNDFFNICCGTFLSKLSNLFSRSWEEDDTTSLSPMHFTHTPTPPGDAASVATTLQIFSVKLEEIKEEALGSNWPLDVYGTIVARDSVDRNRNVLFHRARNNCQILKEKEASLHLTGPSRAIVAIDPVDFEIELKVKGSSTKSSQDRVLMRQTFIYSGGSESTLLSNTNCKIMLQCAKLENTVQATVVSVRVINWRKRAWPFRHGGKVSCVAKGSVKPQVGGKKVVLQHQLSMANSSQGYLHLSRHAVSVELNGELGVIISSPKHSGHIFFPAQECKSSRGICHLGPYEVEVTVAWSLLIQDKRCFISREECVDDGQAFEHTAKVIQRRKITSVTRSATKIYSLLDLISKSVMKLKTEPKLRISDFSISEVQMHLNYIYFDVSSLLQMMEKVHKGYSATDRQAPRTYYKYGLNAIFNGLHQLCTQLDQMGLLSYKGESQSFSELFRDNITKIKLDELEPPVTSMENVEAAKGKDQVSPSISSSTNIKFEIEEAKEMGGEEEDCDVPQTEQEYFEYYRQGWVYNWSIFCGTFTQTSE